MCWISQSERANSNNNVYVYYDGVFESQFSMGIELKIITIIDNKKISITHLACFGVLWIGILISSSSIKSYSSFASNTYSNILRQNFRWLKKKLATISELLSPKNNHRMDTLNVFTNY